MLCRRSFNDEWCVWYRWIDAYKRTTVELELDIGDNFAAKSWARPAGVFRAWVSPIDTHTLIAYLSHRNLLVTRSITSTKLRLRAWNYCFNICESKEATSTRGTSVSLFVSSLYDNSFLLTRLNFVSRELWRVFFLILFTKKVHFI